MAGSTLSLPHTVKNLFGTKLIQYHMYTTGIIIYWKLSTAPEWQSCNDCLIKSDTSFWTQMCITRFFRSRSSLGGNSYPGAKHSNQFKDPALLGAGEMALKIRGTHALPEDSVPSTHIRRLIKTYPSSSGSLVPYHLHVRMLCICTDIYKYLHIHKQKQYLKKTLHTCRSAK